MKFQTTILSRIFALSAVGCAIGRHFLFVCTCLWVYLQTALQCISPDFDRHMLIFQAS